MKDENNRYFFSKYPLLFADVGEPSHKSNMCFGLECGDGWFNLIDELCSKIEPKIQEWIEHNPEEKSHPRLFQVKEKFGGLRFYMQDAYKFGINDEELYNEMSKLIVDAEAESYKVCDKCGVAGSFRGDLIWKRTLCEICYKEIKSDR